MCWPFLFLESNWQPAAKSQHQL